jgi:hypothetical protein
MRVEIGDNPNLARRLSPRNQTMSQFLPLSVSALVLQAKQLEVDAVRQLAERVELASVIGDLIHALQGERGASSVYLASGGQRFVLERQTAVAQAQPIEACLRVLFAEQLAPDHNASARTLSLMAWVLLNLEALPGLREQIDHRTPTAHEAVATFSGVIAGLLELLFHVADAAKHPAVSRLLVSLVHLLQGKEAAGQERALGAQLLASGASDEPEQQRIVHLIDAQERSLSVFESFAEAALCARWRQHQLTPKVAQLERLRRALCTARPGVKLDTALSEAWFDAASERITEMWHVQIELVTCLREACQAQLVATQQDLQDAEGLLKQLRDNPPPHTHAVARFFNATEAPDEAPTLGASPDGATVASLAELLQAQSARLASMELELGAAKRALHERKVIERAKGALMSRLGMSEEAAFRSLQKAAMDHNKRLLDVAEATLALPDSFFAGPGRGTR